MTFENRLSAFVKLGAFLNEKICSESVEFICCNLSPQGKLDVCADNISAPAQIKSTPY